MTESEESTQLFIGFLAGLSGLIFISHICALLFFEIPCERTGLNVVCMLRAVLTFFVGLIALPAGIIEILTGLLGISSSLVANATFFGVCTTCLLLILFRKQLFEGAVVSASFVAKPTEEEKKSPPPPPFTESEKTVKKETERQASRADLERAIREMEEAKARVDELNKKR